jgi:hypothetical protein
MGRGEPCVRLKMVFLFFKELKQANTRFAPTLRLLKVDLGQENPLTKRPKWIKISLKKSSQGVYKWQTQSSS